MATLTRTFLERFVDEDSHYSVLDEMSAFLNGYPHPHEHHEVGNSNTQYDHNSNAVRLGSQSLYYDDHQYQERTEYEEGIEQSSISQ